MPENHKFLVLLLYYERPNLLRNALTSVLRADNHYHNWFLVVHDDGSEHQAGPIVQEVMAPALDRVGVIRTEMTVQEKVDSGGILGQQINEIIKAAMWDIRPDVLMMLCDDDELHPLVFKNLDKFFTENPKVMSCYSKVVCFDPLTENTDDIVEDRQLEGELRLMSIKLNRWSEPINGKDNVDASQVAWRAACHEAGAWFHYPCVKNHDAYFFEHLFHKCGPMVPTGFVSQYKGVHAKQLGTIGAWQAWTSKDIDKGSRTDGCEITQRERDCQADQEGTG